MSLIWEKYPNRYTWIGKHQNYKERALVTRVFYTPHNQPSQDMYVVQIVVPEKSLKMAEVLPQASAFNSLVEAKNWADLAHPSTNKKEFEELIGANGHANNP